MVEQNLALLRQAAAAGADIALTSEAINFPGQLRCLAGLSSYELVAANQDRVIFEASHIAWEAHMSILRQRRGALDWVSLSQPAYGRGLQRRGLADVEPQGVCRARAPRG